jgi:hypothetical protein
MNILEKRRLPCLGDWGKCLVCLVCRSVSKQASERDRLHTPIGDDGAQTLNVPQFKGDGLGNGVLIVKAAYGYKGNRP